MVEPLVSVITDIGIDHTEFLGYTLTEIAREKAGILRQNGVLVTLSQHPEANAALGDVAVQLDVRGVDASRYLPPRGFKGVPEAAPGTHPGSASGTALDQEPGAGPALVGRHTKTLVPLNRNELEGPSPIVLDAGAPGGPDPVHVSGEASPLGRNSYPISVEGSVLLLDFPLPGQHQQRNLALAVATAVELRTNHGFQIPDEAIEKGVRTTHWPGRLEWIPAVAGTSRAHPPVLLDVAHNPAGAWTLRAALASLPEDRPRTLLFSCLADKQIEEMARILLPLFDSTSGDPARRRDHIVFAPIANPRAALVEQLLAAAHALDIPAHAAPHLAAALQQAEALTPPGGVIVVTGSVYLIGEVRGLLLARQDREGTSPIPSGSAAV